MTYTDAWLLQVTSGSLIQNSADGRLIAHNIVWSEPATPATLPIYVGTDTPTGLYVGADSVTAIYVGSTQIFGV